MSAGLSLSAVLAANIIERVGAYVGFVAFLGLAILALLYFSQARDVRRLREWAGRAPERAAELESRLGQQRGPARVATKPQVSAGAQKPAAAQTAAGRAGQQGAKPPGAPAKPAQPPAKPGQVPSKPLPSPAAAAESGPSGKVAGPDADEERAGDESKAAGSPKAEEVPGATGVAASTNGPAASQSEPEVVEQPTVAQRSLEPIEPQEPLEPLTAEHFMPGTSFRQSSQRQRKPLTHRARNVHIPQLRYLLASLAIFVFLVLGIGTAIGVIDIGGGDGDGTKQARKDRRSQRQARSAPANVDPSQVTVAVLNGTTVTGLAYQVSQEAQSSGFVVGNVTNAATTDQQGTQVLYAPGQKNAARVVADRLGISSIAPVDSVNSEIAGSADAVVLVGADRS